MTFVITAPGTVGTGALTASCSSSTQEEAARSVNVKSANALLIEMECILCYFDFVIVNDTGSISKKISETSKVFCIWLYGVPLIPSITDLMYPLSVST